MAVRRGIGLGFPHEDGPIGNGRGLVWVWWRPDTVWIAHSSSRLVRLCAIQRFVVVATLGGGPERVDLGDVMVLCGLQAHRP